MGKNHILLNFLVVTLIAVRFKKDSNAILLDNHAKLFVEMDITSEKRDAMIITLTAMMGKR